MKIYILCKKYLLEHKLALTIHIALTILATAIGVLSPYIIGDFLDSLVEGANLHVILQFCIVFGGLNIARILKDYIAAIIYIKLQTQMGYSLNRDIIRHIQNLSLSYSSRQDSAYLSKRVGSDSVSLIVFCITVLQGTIANVIMLVAPFIVLIAMNWSITILLMSFLVIYASLFFIFKKPLYNAGFAFKEAQSNFFSSIFEQLKYIKLIKINSIQNEINYRANDSFLHLKETATNNQKINYLYSGLDGFVTTMARIALFVVGGLQVLSGNFTIGMFTVFSIYFGMMLISIRYFFNLGATYQKTLVAYDRVEEILKIEKEQYGTKLIDSMVKIKLQNVSFSYNEGKAQQFISNLDLEFTKGNIYGISGSNGVGKSTLVNLIIGLYINEYSGHISYNGIDIRQLDIPTIRKNLFGFAEQESLLINDSIQSNLDFGSNNGDTKHLEKCIDVLEMTEFISEHSLDFIIDEKNVNTSGGEKQKICVLKVLYKNPNVMIFDEPTAALDAQTTQKFMLYLQEIKSNKIILIITHDKDIKEKCDVLIEMK